MFGVGRCAEGLYRAGLALLLFPFLAVPSQAEAWPQRPVKFIVTLGPGSGVDFGTRLLGDRLSKRWGQPVIIENRPGGDAVVAVTAVISANDDHVLLASPTSALTAHPYVLQQMPYKDSDLLPIARGWNTVIVIAVPSSLEAKTMGDLVAMTRRLQESLTGPARPGLSISCSRAFSRKTIWTWRECLIEIRRTPPMILPQDASN